VSEVADSKPKKVVSRSWTRNTYFWIALILFVLGLLAIFKGDNAIRDPGQKKENLLWAIYFGASLVMFINGYLSHRLFIKNLDDEQS
jgi:cell division protein FtsW (lipid II flippase)